MINFKYKIRGCNNNIYIIKNGIKRKLKPFEKIRGLKIEIAGNNNYIEINLKNPHIKHSNISITANNVKIKIDEFNKIENLHICAGCGNNQKIEFGKGITINGVMVFLNEENAKFIVGQNCLFSNDIRVWPTDGHTILDKNSNKVLNSEKKGVIIGDNCWIGQSVSIAKNAVLAKNTIVGMCAVVTKAFDEENTTIAGNPAKIVKKNTYWQHRTPYSYIANHQ